MKRVEQNGTDLKLSKKQREAAEMLADPDFKGNSTKIINSLGVPRTTFYRWLKNPEFISYVNELIDLYTDSELGTVWKALIRRCVIGDVRAIKLYFELKGKYKQQVEHSDTRENNLFEAIDAWKEDDFNDLSEIQQTSNVGVEMVENKRTQE